MGGGPDGTNGRYAAAGSSEELTAVFTFCLVNNYF